jgi:uncharacterized cupredoxin-like copper-binding protein
VDVVRRFPYLIAVCCCLVVLAGGGFLYFRREANEAISTPSPTIIQAGGGIDESSPMAGAGDFELNAKDIAFEPTELRIKLVDEPVTIRIFNAGAVLHNFSIDSLGIGQDVNPDESVDIVIPEGTKLGTYSYYCSVPGHKEAGMVGTLIVEASASQAQGATTNPVDMSDDVPVPAVTDTAKLMSFVPEVGELPQDLEFIYLEPYTAEEETAGFLDAAAELEFLDADGWKADVSSTFALPDSVTSAQGDVLSVNVRVAEFEQPEGALAFLDRRFTARITDEPFPESEVPVRAVGDFSKATLWEISDSEVGITVFTQYGPYAILVYTRSLGGDPTEVSARVSQLVIDKISGASPTSVLFSDSHGAGQAASSSIAGQLSPAEPSELWLLDDSGSLAAIAFSDVDGHFDFGNVEAGEYLISLVQGGVCGYTYEQEGDSYGWLELPENHAAQVSISGCLFTV